MLPQDRYYTVRKLLSPTAVALLPENSYLLLAVVPYYLAERAAPVPTYGRPLRASCCSLASGSRILGAVCRCYGRGQTRARCFYKGERQVAVGRDRRTDPTAGRTCCRPLALAGYGIKGEGPSAHTQKSQRGKEKTAKDE